MHSRFSISAEIARAMHCTADIERTLALRNIAQTLYQPGDNQGGRAAGFDDIEANRHEQRLARIFDSLRHQSGSTQIGELDMVQFAMDRQLDHAICGLAILTGLAATMIEAAFSSNTPDLLLVACRMRNFAWSSTKYMLALRSVVPDPEQLEEWAEEYHQIPIYLAQRFGRFLHVHTGAPALRLL